MVKLLKQLSNYVDKEGNEKTATNFFVECGGERIPVEVRYFNGPDGEPDRYYRARKMVLASHAEELPKKKKVKLPEDKLCPKCKRFMLVDDHDGYDAVYFTCEECGINVTCYSDGTETVYIDGEPLSASQLASLTPIADDLPI